jgi:hypothetical protein
MSLDAVLVRCDGEGAAVLRYADARVEAFKGSGPGHAAFTGG